MSLMPKEVLAFMYLSIFIGFGAFISMGSDLKSIIIVMSLFGIFGIGGFILIWKHKQQPLESGSGKQ